MNINKSKINKEAKLKLLKNEYNNLKNKLEILSQNYSNIKKHNNINILFKIPEIKEPKINPKYALILCLIAFIFGFYLTK